MLVLLLEGNTVLCWFSSFPWGQFQTTLTSAPPPRPQPPLYETLMSSAWCCHLSAYDTQLYISAHGKLSERCWSLSCSPKSGTIDLNGNNGLWLNLARLNGIGFWGLLIPRTYHLWFWMGLVLPQTDLLCRVLLDSLACLKSRWQLGPIPCYVPVVPIPGPGGSAYCYLCPGHLLTGLQ